MRSRFRLSILLILFVTAPAVAEPGMHPFQVCTRQVLESVVSKKDQFVASWKKFWQEVRQDGPKRFFIKDLPETKLPEERKLFGTLWPTEKSDQSWFWNIEQNLVQFVPRRVTKLIYRKPYDFMPFSTGYRALEKRLLPKGKTVTGLWKTAGHVSFYPLTWYGLSDRLLARFENKKKLDDLDFVIDHDYRLRSIREQFGDVNERKKKGSLDEARKEALLIRSRYEAYFTMMENFTKQGIAFDDPQTTAAIFSDSTTVRAIGPLFSDILEVTNPDFYKGKPFLDASALKQKNPGIVNELFRLNHIKIMVASNGENLLKDAKETPPQLKEAFRDQPYLKKLKDAVAAGELSLADADAAFNQMIEWNTRLKMFGVLGVIPHKIEKGRVTNEVLHIEDLEEEILENAKHPGKD